MAPRAPSPDNAAVFCPWDIRKRRSMPQLPALSVEDLRSYHGQIRQRYDAFAKRGVKLNLTRGKPSAAQLDLSQPAAGAARSRRLHVRATSTAATTANSPGLPELRALLGTGVRRHAGSGHHRRERQPVADARHRRLLAAQGQLRQRAAVVEGIAHRVPVSGARLRPSLFHLPGIRHRNDSGAADRHRSRHGRRREAGRRPIADQGHLVRAEVQQSRPAPCIRTRRSSGWRR